MTRHVGQHPHPDVEAVLHHDHVQVAEIRAGARAHRSADEIDRVRHFLGRFRRRALVEEVGRKVGETELRLWIGRAAGPDQQPRADDRLFVVKNGDDLQSIRELLQLVRREFHVTGRQRLRRTF